MLRCVPSTSRLANSDLRVILELCSNSPPCSMRLKLPYLGTISTTAAGSTETYITWMEWPLYVTHHPTSKANCWLIDLNLTSTINLTVDCKKGLHRQCADLSYHGRILPVVSVMERSGKVTTWAPGNIWKSPSQCYSVMRSLVWHSMEVSRFLHIVMTGIEIQDTEPFTYASRRWGFLW